MIRTTNLMDDLWQVLTLASKELRQGYGARVSQSFEVEEFYETWTLIHNTAETARAAIAKAEKRPRVTANQE
jgi:hypothetical protein